MSDTRYIAMADDHVMFRKGLSTLINLFPNYAVLFEASEGKEFISKIDPEHLPHIALLDISMPGMDGYETAAWIKSNYPEIKILALSTMEAETAIIRMIKCGARGYVLKDAEPGELKLAFDEILSMGFFYNEVVTKKVMRSVSSLIDEKNIQDLVNLTDREIDFLKRVCSEKSYKEIADDMCLSPRTIDGYREALFEKLNITSRVGLILYAIKNKIVVI